MDKLKEIAAVVFGSKAVLQGKGRTFCKVPMWLGVLMALASVRLTLITIVLAVAFGMKLTVVKA